MSHSRTRLMERYLAAMLSAYEGCRLGAERNRRVAEILEGNPSVGDLSAMLSDYEQRIYPSRLACSAARWEAAAERIVDGGWVPQDDSGRER